MLNAANKELRVGGEGQTLINMNTRTQFYRLCHQSGIRTCNQKNIFNKILDIRFEVVNNCAVYLILNINTQVN